MKTFKNLILSSLAVSFFCFTGCKDQLKKKTVEEGIPTVETNSGRVSGTLDQGVYAFKGIPYAQADRFMPPEDPVPWDDVRECIEVGPVAKQVVEWIDESNMDAEKLFSVNVWTQGKSHSNKRPVIVWSQGAGYLVQR